MATAPNRFFMEQIAPDAWRLSEGTDNKAQVDSYLVVGKERAAYIDSLQFMQPVSLAAKVREITDLPVDVLLTHGHSDHAGLELVNFVEAGGFTLHMSHADIELGRAMASRARDVSPEVLEKYVSLFSPDVMHDINEGDVFDLGGVKLEALRVAGHTPGSTCFLDREGKRCFTGDAFGEFMQLEHSLKIKTYRDEIMRFEKNVADVYDALIWSGHLFLHDPQNTMAHATNMRELCEMLISGEYSGDEILPDPANPMTMFFRGSFLASYKTIHKLYYTKSKLED